MIVIVLLFEKKRADGKNSLEKNVDDISIKSRLTSPRFASENCASGSEKLTRSSAFKVQLLLFSECM